MKPTSVRQSHRLMSFPALVGVQWQKLHRLEKPISSDASSLTRDHSITDPEDAHFK
jgi:hypothetical protein